MVVWLVGLSASGKTSVAKKILNALNTPVSNEWVLVDGDYVRDHFKEDLGHDIESRKKNSRRIQKLCKELDEQGRNVIACVLSIFPEHQAENFELFSNYLQVYLSTSLSELKKRDNKNLYASAMNGDIGDVVGVQIKFPQPDSRSYVICTENRNVEDIAQEIILNVVKKEPVYPYSQKSLWKDQQYKYQYTKTYGKLLLDTYRKSREHFLTNNTLTLEDDEHLAQKILGIFPENERSEFQAFLISCITEKLSADKRKMIFRLIKKFEVSKKIYSSYNLITLKRLKEADERPINLMLFGVVLSRLFSIENSYKRVVVLNAILKINDKVLALVDEACSESEAFLLTFSIKSELLFLNEFVEIT